MTKRVAEGAKIPPLFEKEEETKLLKTLTPVLLSKSGVSLYLDLSPYLLKKACERLQEAPIDMAPLLSFAFVFENKIIGILSWTDYRKNHDMWWTIYSTSPYWCTKKVLDYLFETAATYFKVVRINALTKTTNQKACSLLKRLGFEKEGCLKKFYPKDKKDAYLWAKFL